MSDRDKTPFMYWWEVGSPFLWTFGLFAAFQFGMACSTSREQDRWQNDIVEHGHAHWEVSETGWSTWHWNEEKEDGQSRAQAKD